MNAPNPDTRPARPAEHPAWLRALPGVALALLALLGPATGSALSTDRDKPIEIEADNAEADDARKVTIYKGGVVITQGTLRIAGDTVTVHYDQNFDMTKMVSEGRPSTFRQLPDGETEYRTARAKRMEYYANEDLIVLLGEAQYGTGDTRVRADRIEYDSLNSRMKAQTQRASGSTSDSDGSTRVRITLQPGSGSNP